MNTPLFIPLKTRYFEAFANGSKNTEYRRYGPGWNERTCYRGRPVIISKGYGKYSRLSGVIEETSVRTDPEAIPGWIDCYGLGRGPAICIKIKLTPTPHA